MREFEIAASYAIGLAKGRGLGEVCADELLLGSLRAVAQFGVVEMGALVLDLEELGVDWVENPPEKSGTKVAYSQAVVELFDRAARIARAEGGGPVRVDHLLAAFAREDSGLMGELKRRYGITSATWRAAVARLSGQLPENGQAPEERADAAGRDYLTPEEAAEALGVHVQTVRGYVRSGKLAALRLAGERAIRIRRSDLETVLEPLVPQT
jgi:excisionase family DNA binding protein